MVDHSVTQIYLYMLPSRKLTVPLSLVLVLVDTRVRTRHVELSITAGGSTGMALSSLLGFFGVLGSLNPGQELVTPEPFAQDFTTLLEHVSVHNSETCAKPSSVSFCGSS